MTITSIQCTYRNQVTQVYRDNNGNVIGGIDYKPANLDRGEPAPTWMAQPMDASKPAFENVSFLNLQAAEYFLLSQAIEAEASKAI